MLKRGGRMAPSVRRALIILPLWTLTMLWMWSWWFTDGQSRYLPLFIPLTLALLYEFALLPTTFFYFVLRAKKPPRRIAPKGKKVAVISLCVPSTESLDIVERQLQAMANITYPHDSWILDEGNNKAIKAIAKQYGIKYFTRRGVRAYNKLIPPFQKKTKAGNVNAWLDHVKRRKYDFFVQLDIDHVPKPNYLHKTLGHFRDHQVAWVQAPSVYSNLASWTARGAAEQELVLQGPLQMGFYGHSETPFIIGSHCTYRMSAIREIGGFQPTRAEDHLDTLHLAKRGYKGVFLPEIIAEGDGPETLNTYLAQQFAWAYSMFQVLLQHSPKLLRTMPFRRKWQFLFAQTWYPLWALAYLTMFICPVLALVSGHEVIIVDPGAMALHFFPVYVCSYLVWWSARPLMQPHNLHLSWRGVMLHIVRWPIIVRALVAATFRIKKPYMITPKGGYAQTTPLVATYRPFLLLGLLSASGVIGANILHNGDILKAQAVFSIMNAILMFTICALDISIRLREVKPKPIEFRQYWLKPVAATLALGLVLVATAVTPYPPTAPTTTYAAAGTSVINLPTPQPVNDTMTKQQLLSQISLVSQSNKALPSIGMYNQSLDFSKAAHPYIQHSFVDWRDDHYFALTLAASAQSGNTPLITVEPRGDENGDALLRAIADGRYDQRIDNLGVAIKASKNPVYIRFGHEMELVDLYPWGDQDPDLYISAYQHVADRLRSEGAQNARFVWSPAGNPGAAAYYPGDAYVDAIGTTVLYDHYWYGAYRPSFNALTSSRQWLQQYGKPVWIVEFGVGQANTEDQKELINEALTHYQQLGFQKLIYLNMADANLVGPDYRLQSVNDFGGLYTPESTPAPKPPVAPIFYPHLTTPK